jgi:hypothetical protein
METKEALHSRILEAKGNTLTDEELQALNLSSRQIALLLSKSPEIQE